MSESYFHSTNPIPDSKSKGKKSVKNLLFFNNFFSFSFNKTFYKVLKNEHQIDVSLCCHCFGRTF